MRPVDQTKFGHPDGNCLAACVASLLHLETDEVPNFCAGDDSGWWTNMLAWLHGHGYTAMCVSMPMQDHLHPAMAIVSGASPRGPWLHATVWQDGVMVHDPHPSRAGIGEPSDAIFLLPLDPLSPR